MHQLSFVTALCLTLVVPAVPAAAQQPRPERPYRGLFASGTEDASELLTAQGMLAAGWSDRIGLQNVRGEEIPAGTMGTTSGTLSYIRDNDAIALGLGASAMTRYYVDSSRFANGAGGMATIAMKPRAGFSVSANAGVMYQPRGLGAAFATSFEPNLQSLSRPDLDAADTLDSYLAYQGQLSLSKQLTRRMTLSGTYAYRTTEAAAFSGAFSSQQYGGGLSYQLLQGLGLRAGYRRDDAHYGDGRDGRRHVIDAGVNYNRALSFSRRTTLTFGTGTSATSAESTLATSGLNDGLRYQLTGHATLTHEVGRTWVASAAYSRQVLLHETWSEPVPTDSVTLTVGGLVNRRLQVTGTARAALGKVGLNQTAPEFDGYQGAASMMYALTQRIGLGVSYSYYRHDSDEGLRVPSGFVTSLQRQTLMAGVTVWIPLMQRARN